MKFDVDELRLMAVHEAGHAVVAMAVGIDVVELRITDNGGECTHLGGPRKGASKIRHRRAALVSLGGYLACAIHCQDVPGYSEWNSWENCSEDLARFRRNKKGLSFGKARKACLAILREEEARLLEMADLLETDLFIDSTNAMKLKR